MGMRALKIGTGVEVTRTNGEAARGYILAGPLKMLAHIGDFYLVGKAAPKQFSEAQRRKGRPRRGETPTPKPVYHEFGMYAREDIRVLRGAPRKDVC